MTQDELKNIEMRVATEKELKAYLGADRVVLAEEKRVELDELRRTRPPFHAKTGISGLDECVDGFRRGQLIVVSGPPKQGKCHGAGTKVLLFDGSVKNVEDVVVGDLLMGPDSQPRTVESLARGREQMYRIIQRGEAYTVNESHILSLQMTGTKKRTPKTKGRVVNISVRDYLNKSTTFKHHAKGWKIGVDWKYVPVEVDPYLLGIWLGDGSSDCSTITSADEEVVQYILRACDENGWKIRITQQKNNRASEYHISNARKKTALSRALWKIGVKKNKHIPMQYKINSREVRLAVLAGVIDTDGHKSSVRGYDCYDIIQKSKALTDDIAFVARSLGMAVTVSPCKKGIKSRGFVGNYYRIRIGGDITQVPVRIARKRSYRKPSKDALRNNIKVVPIGVGEYYGFTLSGDHLYLLGDFTVTHNTLICQNFTRRFTDQGLRCLWFSYELGYEELFEKFPMQKLDFYVPNHLQSGNVEWIEKKIIESKAKYGVDMVFIDHLDFLRDTKVLSGISLNLSAYVGGIVQKIKSMAREQNVVIFLMSHIRKNQWTTSDLPSSEELRDSGQIAQLADIVMMIVRKRAERGSEEIYDGNRALVGVIENRHNGRTKKVHVELVDKELIEIPHGYENAHTDTSKVW